MLHIKLFTLVFLCFVALLGAERVEPKNKLLPRTNDPNLLDLYKKPLIFYSNVEMPPVFQRRGGINFTEINISGNPTEPYGNANMEFPWRTPAGTHLKTVKTIKFVYLPGPITYEEKTMQRTVLIPKDEQVVVWYYPDGTVFGEILFVSHKGVDYPFDLRTRKKVSNRWRMNAYRPVLSREELLTWLAKNRPEISMKEDIKIEELKNPHPTVIFNQKAAVDKLPELPDDVVKELLKLPFRSAFGKEWITYKGVEGHAPTTDAEFHIVPKQYKGAFMAVDSKSCMTCHVTTLKDADDFQPIRDWYGRVRGSDNIFSFHIFDPKSAAKDAILKKRELNQDLINKGLLKSIQSTKN